MKTCVVLLMVILTGTSLFIVALFCARHQRLPVGGGEVINWMLGLTA